MFNPNAKDTKISKWQAYNMYVSQNPLACKSKFMRKMLIMDDSAAIKYSAKVAKRVLGNDATNFDVVIAVKKADAVVERFNPSDYDSLTKTGRKLTKFIAVTCAAFGTAMLAMGISALHNVASKPENLVYFAAAIAYPILPAFAATWDIVGNWKKTYGALAAQIEGAILSAKKETIEIVSSAQIKQK